MKKLSILSILIILTFILVILSSCRNNNGTDSVSTQPTSSSKVNLVTDDKTDWKKAYKNYLVSYTPEMGFITLGLADFNADEQPELIILDDSHGTLGGKYTIVSYQNGTAVEICQYGMSSSIAEVNNQLFFYRSFDLIHSSGGTYGYGFVSRLDNTNGIFSMNNLLESRIDYNYDNTLEESSWKLEGEESVLKSSDFKKYLTIQEFADSKWQDISADKYISLKTTYIGADPSGKQITDYFKHKLNFLITQTMSVLLHKVS